MLIPFCSSIFTESPFNSISRPSCLIKKALRVPGCTSVRKSSSGVGVDSGSCWKYRNVPVPIRIIMAAAIFNKPGDTHLFLG